MNADSGPPRQLSITWGQRTFGYTLVVEARRDLAITVHPDLRVDVRAPDNRPLASVLERVRARRSWIARQLEEFEQLPRIPPPEFVSGETIFYLGREYRLRVERGAHSSRLYSGRLHIRVPGSGGGAAVRALVRDWFKRRSREVFERRLTRMQGDVPMLRGLKPVIRVRHMSRRWGSCSPKGVISLNPALSQTPVPCVDYVIVHELLHLIEPSHSPRFYKLLDRAMPQWPERRRRLARAAVRWD